MTVFLSIGKVCELLGISLSTAYRWIKSGKLKSEFRTVGNHRRFDLAQIKHNFINANINNNENKLLNFAKSHNYSNIISITDLGSGLNFKKSGLNQLLNLILTQQIQNLIINHKDHLLRFGSELIFKLCDFYHINVIIIEDKSLTFEETLTHDVIELMTVFCAKLYGKRSHKNKLKSI